MEFKIISTQFNSGIFKNSDESVKKVDSIASFGDENYYAIRIIDNKKGGILYAVRKDKVVYSLILLGLLPNSNNMVKNIIEPKIIKLENFKL